MIVAVVSVVNECVLVRVQRWDDCLWGMGTPECREVKVAFVVWDAKRVFWVEHTLQNLAVSE